MKYLKYIAIVGLLGFSSCSKDFLGDDFLVKEPLDQLSDPAFWSSENNVRTYTYGFYNSYFKGYGKNNTWGIYFSGQGLNDDFAPTTPVEFTLNVPTSGGGWSPALPASQTVVGIKSYYSRIRKANQFIESVPIAPISDEAKNHWSGIGRFFRALEYANFVNSFGDVPYIDHVMTENDPDLYRAKDSRVFVMDKVLEDFKFAVEAVRAIDGADKQSVNKYVVLAYMSRIFLFEGTWLKYHNIDKEKSKTYLEASKWASEEIIKSGKFSLGSDYRVLFSSESLVGNPEMILFKEYVNGVLQHSLMSYNNKESQSGISKDAIDNYLASDGLPIYASKLYKGDHLVSDVLTNRDGRLPAIIVPELRLMSVVANYSSSGYSTRKFLNDKLKDDVLGSSYLNVTDAPILRFGEVLVNYAEAAAELGILSQQDLDISINKLRARNGVNLPALQIIGGNPAVAGVIYDDPKRDADVPALIWEVRRERRSELIFEGFRLDDLRRWKKLIYADTEKNPMINRGAYLDLSKYPNGLKGVNVDGDGVKGFIIPSFVNKRVVLDKYYLSPIPLDQIALYKDHGVILEQNPGW